VPRRRGAAPVLRARGAGDAPVGDEVLGVQGDGRKHQVLLSDLCTRHFPRLAWVVDAGAQVLTLQVHTFLHALTLPPIELGVDEKVLEALERIDRKLASIPSARSSGWTSSSSSTERAAGEGSRRPSPTPERSRSLAGRRARSFGG
jgi:hypothetical protein